MITGLVLLEMYKLLRGEKRIDQYRCGTLSFVLLFALDFVIFCFVFLSFGGTSFCVLTVCL